MTTETKTFPTADVLSAVTGVLVSKIDGVYEVLSWMSGEPIWTHQLPRVSREAQTAVIAMHPTIQKAVDEAEQVNGDTWQNWLSVWLDRYGPEIAVPRLSEDQHERIDPLSELAEKMPPDRIVVIKGADK